MQENAFDNVVCKMAAILSLPQCVKEWGFSSNVGSLSSDPLVVDVGICVDFEFEF